MSKKTIKGEDGKIYTVKENKPWYKKVWLWLTLAIISVAGIALAINMNSSISSNSASDSKTDQSSNYDTDTDEDSNSTNTEDTNYSDSSNDSADSDDSSDSLKIGDDNIDISDHKTYSPELSDTSWSSAEVYISKIDVYKTDGPYNNSDDKEFNGVVAIDMSITPSQDISAFPTQGTLNTSNGQQIDADSLSSDSFDGEINSGATANGVVYFLIPNMDKASDLTSARFKFDASYDTDDYDDDNDYKTYDITIPLES